MNWSPHEDSTNHARPPTFVRFYDCDHVERDRGVQRIETSGPKNSLTEHLGRVSFSKPAGSFPVG
jgi:hypothetical protein